MISHDEARQVAALLGWAYYTPVINRRCTALLCEYANQYVLSVRVQVYVELCEIVTAQLVTNITNGKRAAREG